MHSSSVHSFLVALISILATISNSVTHQMSQYERVLLSLSHLSFGQIERPIFNSVDSRSIGIY
ncbi:hypothetical protein KC19_9G168500 [Ceratodon purpureus]|uniref:Secreted protein n=1 Tax=Ceratodon purpureus TaxID=3225 RepID=A0A8T0GV23_CERPU|nr:hypothetical protein KC19_9G168500 [Ceratodon purpureus]